MILLLGLISGCSGDRTIYLKSTYGDGLGQQTKIMYRGVQVGEITDFSIIQDEVLFETTIYSNVQIPRDAKFTIDQHDFFNKAIFIKPGKRKQFIQDGDTIMIEPFKQPPSIKIDDEVIEKAEEFLKEVTGVNQQDSMIQQLDRLNKSLQDIDQELKRMTPEPASKNP